MQNYVTPRALLTRAAAQDALKDGWAWPLLGGVRAFAAIELSARDQAMGSRIVARAGAGVLAPHLESRLAALAVPRAPFAGFDLAQPLLMGVLNVTPDSFSDGGRYQTVSTAIAHGVALAEAGAAIIDIGGESTRPGAEPVAPDEEAARVLPPVKALAERGICVSIDTRHAAVMAAAIAAGARVVNDVTALTGEARSLKLLADSSVSVVLMHMQGDPRTMQVDPTYAWAPGDIYDFLEGRITACITAGVAPARIAIDPGFGFGKTDVHTLQLLDHLAMFHGLGCPLMVGVSRKGFIGRVSNGEGASHRLPGSLAVALHAATQGAQILRVHDVAETRQALALAARLAQGR